MSARDAGPSGACVQPPPAQEAEEVLQVIMRDGTFDELRKLIVDDLKENAGLRDYVEAKVAESETLAAAGLERRPRKELFGKLRMELEGIVLEKAVRAAWEGMSVEGSRVSALIDLRVHEALCSLHDSRIEDHEYAHPHAHALGQQFPALQQRPGP